MDRQHTEQEEKLVKINVDMVHGPSPAPCRGSFKCMIALVAVMGLVLIVLVIGFYTFHTLHCVQDVQKIHEVSKVYMTGTLQGADGQGTHNIFTVAKGAVYLIYGWMKMKDFTNEEITLMQTYNGKLMVLEKKKVEEEEVFFFQRALLANNSTISMHFKSSYKDSLFHLYEL